MNYGAIYGRGLWVMIALLLLSLWPFLGGQLISWILCTLWGGDSGEFSMGVMLGILFLPLSLGHKVGLELIQSMVSSQLTGDTK